MKQIKANVLIPPKRVIHALVRDNFAIFLLFSLSLSPVFIQCRVANHFPISVGRRFARLHDALEGLIVDDWADFEPREAASLLPESLRRVSPTSQQKWLL